MDPKVCIAAIMIVFTATGWAAQSGPVEQVPAVASAYQTSMGRATIADSPRIVFYGATQAQAERMLWAIDRFSDSGLELPSLEIYFAQGCQERFAAWGRIQWDSAIPWRIEVCTTAVYLHELAHAWGRWNLTDTDRQMFLDLRGLDAWQGSDVPWVERGQEDLASLVSRVLAQGVDNYRSGDQVTDLDHFERITGVPVPVVRVADPTGLESESPQY
ncbi:MAG: hypothetical protein ACC658_02505 [Acidimicrobiia bacterium]